MLLSRLLPASAGRLGADVEVTGLTADSRAVKPGFLFAALPGAKADGRAFIQDAVARGAVAVLAPAGTLEGSGFPLPLITDPEPRRVFALAAAAFHGRQPETVVAVTGTNGKTSTVHFTRQIWARLGHASASLGTLGVIGDGFSRYGAMTTPDPVALSATLAEVKDAGIERLALEASSHGLTQFRLDGVRIQAAAFTNLSRDHLDYHQTMNAYFAAKAQLFQRVLAEGGAAVLNADVPEFAALAEICSIRSLPVLAYGAAGEAIRVLAVTPLTHGQRLELEVLGARTTVDLPLAGRFQAWNALAALGLALATGSEREPALEALAHLEGVPGRLQHVATSVLGAPVFVDYAHTPDALETVLTALRPHVDGRVDGRLWVVFGCGGDRDRGKRPLMGALAVRLADRVIVTDDNPRTEEPASIRRAILDQAPGALEIANRRDAIGQAVAGLKAGDVLVVAGKGHEQGQIIGQDIRPFDDATEARAAVAEVGA